MRNISRILSLALACAICAAPSHAQHPANSQEFPEKILYTGTNLSTRGISPNAMQLAEQLGLISLFSQVKSVENQLKLVDANGSDGLRLRLELLELRNQVRDVLQKAGLEVDYMLAMIADERNLNSELLTAFLDKNDKVIATTGAIGFGINGLLWPVGAALELAELARPAGIIGIPAGIIPTLASGYALFKVRGGRYHAQPSPNLLAKIFGRPITPDIEYPESIWSFLNTIPASEAGPETRLEQIIDRWVADKNIPQFNDRGSNEQIDVMTGHIPPKRTVTISVLTHRQAMLEQLSGEISKMNQLLLELTLVLTGDKRLSLSGS